MAGKRQQPGHFYSVFINGSGQQDTELWYFGFNERAASWQFYKAIERARVRGANSVDLRQDGKPLATVNVSRAVTA